MLVLLSIDTFLNSTLTLDHPDAQACVRILFACLAGALIGIERELRGREAGFRTNTLVCAGSALVMLISIRMTTLSLHWNPVANITMDPGRIAYGVMAGIGFLGAGAIIHSGRGIHGLTTAAALWCIAALGLAFGAGFYTMGIFTTLMVLLILWAMHPVELRLPRRYERSVTVRATWGPTLLDDVTQRFTSPHYLIKDISLTRDPGQPYADVTLQLIFNRTRDYRQLGRELLADKQYTVIAISETVSTS